MIISLRMKLTTAKMILCALSDTTEHAVSMVTPMSINGLINKNDSRYLNNKLYNLIVINSSSKRVNVKCRLDLTKSLVTHFNTNKLILELSLPLDW